MPSASAARVRGLLHDTGINYLHGALPRDLAGNISPLREGWGDLVDNTGTGAQDFVRSIDRANPAKTFYFVHLLEPHVPWDLLPSGDRYNDGSVIAGITDDWEPGKYEQWRDEPRLVDQGIQRIVRRLSGVLDQAAPVLAIAAPRRFDEQELGPIAFDLLAPGFFGQPYQIRLVPEAGIGELVENGGDAHLAARRAIRESVGRKGARKVVMGNRRRRRAAILAPGDPRRGGSALVVGG